MKRLILFALVLWSLKASAQINIPGEIAYKYMGQRVTVYGSVFRVKPIKGTNGMLVTFGSRYTLKGLTLKLSKPYKLQATTYNATNLKEKFITVTGKIINAKGKPMIDGDDPSTTIDIQESIAQY
jgi:hypothetical protein